MLKVRKIFLILAFLSCVPVAYSQIIPSAADLAPADNAGADLNRTVRDLQKSTIERDLSRERKFSQKKEEKVDGSAAAKADIPETRVMLKKVEFSESKVLSNEQLREFAAKYEDRVVGIAELNELVGKINLWYRANGYITAMAALPPQELKDGKLRIVLIEGTMGQVKIEGNTNTRNSYIRNRVKIPEGELLDIRSLDRSLAWFNGTNDVKLRIKLQAGAEPGTTDCYILAYEPADNVGSLFVDTAGNRSTGQTRSGFSYTDYSVSGRRDVFNMTALAAKNSKSAIMSYNTPINRRGTRLSLYNSFNSLVIIQDDANGFSIKGRSSSLGLSLTHPLKITTNYREELVLDVHRQNAENKVLGMTFVDDEEKRYSLGKSFLKLLSGEALYFKPTWSYCEYEGLSGRKHVQKFALDGLWQKVRTTGQQINLRVAGQKAADDFMPSSDQFLLGGLYSVRGYNESVIGGDSGLNLKVDYLFPIKALESAQLFTFYDWGRIYGKSLLVTKMIHSFGFGFRHSFANDSQITFTVGFPLEKEIGDQRADSHKFDLSLNFLF